MLAGAGLAHALDDLRREQLRRRDDGLDLLGAVGAVRVLHQRVEVALELLVGLGLALQDQRLVEVAVAQLARLVGEHRVAALGGQLEPVEHAAELVADGADELVGALQAPLEDRRHGGARQVGALLGDEQAVARLLQRRGAVQAVDAVVRERALQQRHEALGQPLGLGVERAQERVQVLLRAVQQLALRVVAGAAQRAHVAEDVQQAVLAGDQLGAAAAVAQGRERAADLVAGDVVAEQHPAQAVQRGVHRPAHPLVRRVGREAHALGGLLGGLGLDRLELQQRRVRGDLHVGAGQHPAHAAGERRRQRGLHLHRLDDRDDVALGHLVALGDRDRDDHGRARGCGRSRRRRG